MSIKAILFDKDGTLLDFDAFWVTVAQRAVEYTLNSIGRTDIDPDEILRAMGVNDGITSIDGVLCYGTHEQVSERIYGVLKKYDVSVSESEIGDISRDGFHESLSAGVLKGTCEDIYEVLKKLKDKGIKLAVVTADDEYMTEKCLSGLGIYTLFDKIYTNDGITPPKPDPYCIHDLCQREGFDASEVLMVGDTLTDANFAKNGGIKMIGVANSERNKEILSPYAFKVVPDISYLYDLLEEVEA